jgi:hypothetical protein
MKLVSYEDITLAGRHLGMFLQKIVSALRPRHVLAETLLDVAPASVISS